ncbi:hypothetical protein NXS19_000648 [Fusarium pseudograminearum]|nr:hypothetical protein NXS19_000648 [Fusarium pseudograminearum]
MLGWVRRRELCGLVDTGTQPEQRYSPEVNKKRVEFGLRILPKFWGQGYAKEGSRAVVKHGLEDLNVEEVFGETMAVNQGSRVIMEKIGLKHVRTFYNKYDTPPPGLRRVKWNTGSQGTSGHRNKYARHSLCVRITK